MSDNQTNTNPDQITDQEISDAIDQIQAAAADLKENGVTLLGQIAGGNTEAVIQASKDAQAALDDHAQKVADLRDVSDETGWNKFEDEFHNFFARQRVKFSEDAIERDARKAQSHAENAQDKAARALSHAAQALSTARVALVDAAQARAYADELAEDLSAPA